MKLSSNEFLLKIVIVLCGIAYYLYGCMALFDMIFDIIYIVALIYIVLLCCFGFVKRFNISLFVCIALTSLGTILFTSAKRVTCIILLYICVELILLPYCAKSKSIEILKRELQILSAVFIGFSFFVIFASLVTYVSEISYVYTNPVVGGNMYLGIDKSTGALIGVFTNANAFSSLLVQNIAFVLYSTRNKWYRPVGLIYTAFLLWMVLLTRSRGGLIGSVIILGITAFAWISKIRHKLSERQIFAFYISIGIIFLLLLYLGGIRIESFVPRDTGEMGRSNSTRFTLWEAGFRALCANPVQFLVGFGGDFKEVISNYIDPSLPERLYGNMHNIYMQTFMTFGILGLAYLLIALHRYVLSSMKNILYAFKANSDLAPLAGLLFALLIISFVESDLYLGKTFLSTVPWIIGGYVYRLSLLRKEQRGAKNKKTAAN